MDWPDSHLSSLSFSDIRKLRESYPDQGSQDRLAPFDRSAYVRELMRENGIHYGLLPALGSPIFEMLKMLPGQMGSRSTPSFQNAGAGLLGFGIGLQDWNAQHKLIPPGLLGMP